MNKKAVQWLYEQLPELVEKGIIPLESVDLIKNHYGLVDKKLGGRMILTMFAIIGTLLIGLGIILILAHNWEQMSRLTRTVLAVGMLIIAQTFAGAVIWFKKDAVWAEGTATFLMVTIGASIALIGQTYHLADNFNTALLVWMLLSIPLVYLMGVMTPALLYLVGVTIWLCNLEYNSSLQYLIWPLLALVAPYYSKLLKKDKAANKTVWLSQLFIVCFYISFEVIFGRYHLSMLNYASLFALTYFAGIIWFDAPVNLRQRPFTLIGLMGCLGVSFLITFKEMWWLLGRKLSNIGSMEYLLAFSLLAFVLFIASKVLATNTNKNLLFGLVPVVVGIGFLLLNFDKSGINSTVLCNVYLLFMSVKLILRGVRQGSLGALNLGMLMMAFLIIMRFLDFNFSFVARGVIFVLLGSCFLVANWVMVRRKKEIQNENK